MGCLGNILWFILGGFVEGCAWTIVGLFWCASIIGLPVGMQCFKFARLSFFPFGKKVVYGTNPFSFLVNVLWFFLGGVELAALATLNGIALCIFIIPIPFGLQCFKIAKLALAPFGARVVKVNDYRA